MNWLPDMDLNHDKQIQSLLCYRYTIGQAGARERLKHSMNASSNRSFRPPARSGRGLVNWLLHIAFWLLPSLVHAQFYTPPILDASTTKFFDANAAFSGKMEMTLGPGDKGDRMLVQFAIREGATRLEMDITQVAADPALKGYFEDMKKAGSAESVTIFNPSKKCAFIILPKLKVYLQTPLPEKEAKELKKRPKPEVMALGKETLDGHPCTKTKLTFNKDTMDVWRTWESPSAIVWKADDLQGTPLRIAGINSVGETNGIMMFKEITLKKPDPALFEAPKGFVKCKDQEEFMGHIMKNWPQRD